MPTLLDDLKAQITALPDRDRAALADYIRATLPPPLPYAEDFELQAEVARRLAEMHAGTVVGIPADEVLDRIDREYP